MTPTDHGDKSQLLTWLPKSSRVPCKDSNDIISVKPLAGDTIRPVSAWGRHLGVADGKALVLSDSEQLFPAESFSVLSLPEPRPVSQPSHHPEGPPDSAGLPCRPGCPLPLPKMRSCILLLGTVYWRSSYSWDSLTTCEAQTFFIGRMRLVSVRAWCFCKKEIAFISIRLDPGSIHRAVEADRGRASGFLIGHYCHLLADAVYYIAWASWETLRSHTLFSLYLQAQCGIKKKKKRARKYLEYLLVFLY